MLVIDSNSVAPAPWQGKTLESATVMTSATVKVSGKKRRRILGNGIKTKQKKEGHYLLKENAIQTPSKADEGFSGSLPCRGKKWKLVDFLSL